MEGFDLLTLLYFVLPQDERVTSLLDTTFISIVPAANPDGFIRARKVNINISVSLRLAK